MASLTGQCLKCGIAIHHSGKLCKACRFTCPDCGGGKGYNSQRCTSCAVRHEWKKGRKSGRVKLETFCLRCGIEFNTTASKLKDGRDKYCSRECKNPPCYSSCGYCGKMFRYSPSARALFCSKSCAYASEKRANNIRLKVLEQWSDPIKRKRLLDGMKLRSQSERWKSAAHFQKGDKHPRYKGNQILRRRGMNNYEYKSWRTAVFRNDNFTCQSCGVKSGMIEAHHIKPWADYPELRFDVSNGITLCRACHYRVHGREYKPKTYHCVVCGKPKTDGRQPRCRSCGVKTRGKLTQ